MGQQGTDATAVGNHRHPLAGIIVDNLRNKIDHPMFEGGKGLSAGDLSQLPVLEPELPDIRILLGNLGKMHAFPLTKMEFLQAAVGYDGGIRPEHQRCSIHRPLQGAAKNRINLKGVKSFPKQGGLLPAKVVEGGIGTAHEDAIFILLGFTVANEIEFGRIHNRYFHTMRKTTKVVISASSTVAPRVSPVMPPSRFFR